MYGFFSFWKIAGTGWNGSTWMEKLTLPSSFHFPEDNDVGTSGKPHSRRRVLLTLLGIGGKLPKKG